MRHHVLAQECLAFVVDDSREVGVDINMPERSLGNKPERSDFRVCPYFTCLDTFLMARSPNPLTFPSDRVGSI